MPLYKNITKEGLEVRKTTKRKYNARVDIWQKKIEK